MCVCARLRSCMRACVRAPSYAFKDCMFDLYVNTRVDGGLLGRGVCDCAEVAVAKQWRRVSNYSGTEYIDQPLQSNLFTTNV